MLGLNAMDLVQGLIELVLGGTCLATLKEIFSWEEMDYAWPTPEARSAALLSLAFIPSHCIITTFDLHNDHLFLTTPRFLPGVPSSLNFISLKDVKNKSPALIPYPSWEMNSLSGSSRTSRLGSVTCIAVDSCSRLWAIDTGVIAELDPKKRRHLGTSALFVFNLRDNTVLRSSPALPSGAYRTLVVEASSADCHSAFGYAADPEAPGLLVYDWSRDRFHTVTHNYFHFDPLEGISYTYVGDKYQRQDGLFGLALLSGTLYFHPLMSTKEFAVPTAVLRNASLARGYIPQYFVAGDRKRISSASVVHPETAVIFYALSEDNGLACWNTMSGGDINDSNQGIIMDYHPTMIYPSDLKVDKSGFLWILSNQFPDYLFGAMEENCKPYHIFKAPVMPLIQGTPCYEIYFRPMN